MTPLENTIKKHTIELTLLREFYDAFTKEQPWCKDKYGKIADVTHSTRYINYECLGNILKDAITSFLESEEYPDIEKFILKQTGLNI